MTSSEIRRPGLIRRFVKLMTVGIILALVATVPAVAFGLPAAARTKWARARAEKVLARILGTPVQIGRIEASWRQGVTLRDVSCKPANYGTAEVTLGVRELRITPEYRKLLWGKARAEVVVVAPDVRVLERIEPGAPSKFRLPRLCRREIKIDGLEIREGVFDLRSEKSKEEVRVEDIRLAGEVLAARGRIDVEVAKFDARLNGGTVTGQGVFALSSGAAKSRVEIKGTGVESNDLAARVLRYALPLFETVPAGSVRGRVDLRFKAEGSAKDVQALIRSAQGEGAFTVREADLRGSRILGAAGKADLAASRFHEADGLFTIRDGKVHVLQALARGPVEARLSGWVDVDGTLEYSVEIAGASPALRVGGTLAEPRALAGPSAPF